MSDVSDDRAIPASAASEVKASVRLLALRLSPVVMALVAEPWTAAALAWDVLRKKSLTADAATEKSAIHAQRHVVNASVILLGLSAAIIAALQITNESRKTCSDEVAWIAAFFTLGSIVLSYKGAHDQVVRPAQLRFADMAFLAGAVALVSSLFAAALQL
jgi:uncharacterized membrane protein SirB2